MIHYITTNGIGNAWVAAELEVLDRLGVPFRLHSLRAPHQNFFDTEWARRLNEATRLIYPLRPLSFGVSLALAPWLFRGRLAAAAANALTGPRENPRARIAAIAHLMVACHWARQLRQEEVSLIHSQWIQSGGTVGWYAARLLGKPFSFTGHAVDLFRDRVALKDKISDAEFIVSISEFHRDFYLSEGARPEQLHVVYCGIDLADFPERGPATGGKPRILSFGRLIEKKGFDVLIDACALLVERGVEFECEIAGDGPEHDALLARVRARGLAQQVVITGKALVQSEISDWLSRGHLFAQPCVWARDNDVDGIPRSLMEAMATGLPSVATRVAGIPDLVIDDLSGLLVEPHDASGLADALQRLIADDDLARRLGRGGRRRVETHFNLETCLVPLAGLFEQCLNRTPAEIETDSAPLTHADSAAE